MTNKPYYPAPDSDSLWLGDKNDWALASVVDWLVTQGRRIANPTLLLSALCQRLLEAGAPIWVVRFSLETIDPQVLLWGFGWDRERNAAGEARIVHNVRDTDAYIGSPVQQVLLSGQPLRRRLDALDPDRDHATYLGWAAKGGTDYLILPLFFHTGNINTFIVITDRKTGFSDIDVAKFTKLVDFVSPILEVIANKRIATALLDTYVGPRTGSKILQGLIKRGDGEIINAALWFSDLRDFTEHTETLPPQQLLTMLNAYFETVAAAVTARGGEILRFIGDAMLIVFPTESGQGVKAACASALDAAVDAFDSLAVLNHQRGRAGEPPIQFGVGLHVGEVIYGNVGAPNRLDFTVMGPAVNRTARLESLTKQVRSAVACSKEFAEQLDQPMRYLGDYPVKGVKQPLAVFAPAEG